MDAATAEQDGDALSAELRRPIGEIFVELGFITSAQLEAALVVQRQTGARIGEILVEQGSLSRLDLASALAEHWEPRRPADDAGGAYSLQGSTPAPLVAQAAPGLSAEDHAAIAELELRLRTAEERLEAAPPNRPRRGLKRRSGKEAESAFQAQLDGLTQRLAALEDLEARLADLRSSVDDVGALRVGDALATGARLAAAEAALEGLEARVREGVDRDLADHFEALAARLDRIEHGLDAVAQLEDRVEALAAAGDPGERLLELSLRIDRTARDGHDRVSGLVEELRAEAARARADAEHATAMVHDEARSLGARLDELLGLRHADARAARVASEQLEARLEELAVKHVEFAEAAHTTVQATEIERSVQDELERIAASVEALGRRLDEQAALGDEQARAVEVALQKGLVGLGKRLTGPNARYTARGKPLRRSIERLGAAVVEAEARLARQMPVSEAEGYVAFAPLDEGYRLVELPGTPPELGETVAVEGCDGPLVVTRYGRSPLPLDGRPCAYLDRA